MSCGASCARMLLIAFNFVFWLSGVAILGVGIWILVDPNLQDKIDVIHTSDEQYFKNAAYILIAFGAFIFLVGFSGCCGAIRNSKCLLGFYIFFLVVVFAGELAAGILAAIYKDEITAEFDKELSTSIRDDYLTNQESWNSVQKEMMCCGGLGPDDYINSTWVVKMNNSDILIPESCCKMADGKITDKAECQMKTTGFFYDVGCKDKLSQWVNDHSVILIGVGCGIAALQIFGMVFAICLCRSLEEEKY